jgi:hypothetical protein
LSITFRELVLKIQGQGRRRGLATLFVVAACFVGSLSARAEGGADKKRATALLKEGAAALDRKDFAVALSKFGEAYQLVPSSKIQFNVGLAQEGLDRPAEATRAYRLYIEGAPEDSAARRADASARIKALRARVTHLMVTADVAIAAVLVDGAERGRTPLAQPIVVSAGHHQVLVQAPEGGADTAPWTRAFRGEGGGTIELQASLVPAAKAPAPVAAAPLPLVPETAKAAPVLVERRSSSDDEPRPVYTRVWFWAVVGVAVAGGVTAAVLATRHPETSFVCPVADCVKP